MGSSANQIKLAKEALTFFHNRASQYPENYRLQFEELVSYYQNKTGNSFLDGFGLALESVDLPTRRVKASMEALADAGEGKLPAQWNAFFGSLSQEATSFSFVDAANEVVAGTARDIANVAVEVGQSAGKLASGLANVLPFLPYLAFGGLALVIFFKAKRL